MTWTPQKKVLNLAPIAGNLMAYIEAQDADALSWAGGGLDEFAATYTNSSGRLQTMFPSLMVLTQECETDLSGEVLIGELQLVLEGTVSGSDANELVLNTKIYARAVESMIANIPAATLGAGTGISNAALMEVQTVFDVLRGQASPSAFLQIFQIRCKYALVAEAYG